MLTPRIRSALVILAASAGLAGCTNLGTYGGIGVGVGSGYGSYGYDPYYSGYGYGYGSRYGYGSPYGYYGWYDGFYYPGAGYWVYDRYGRHHRITERQSHYWRNMLEKFREARGTQAAAEVKENWSGFRRPSATAASTGATSVVEPGRSALRQRAIEQRAQRQQAQSERREVRSERQEARQQAISERRQERRARRGSTDE